MVVFPQLRARNVRRHDLCIHEHLDQPPASRGEWHAHGIAKTNLQERSVARVQPEDPFHAARQKRGADERPRKEGKQDECDGSSKQWIQATPNGGSDTVVNYGVRATSGPNPPSSPVGHDLWYNTTDKNLYVFAKASADATASWLKTHDVVEPGSFISSPVIGQ